MLSPTITKYLKKLKQNKEIISTTTNKFIPLNQYKQGFKNPSGRHLGHHHSLLSPDGNQYNKNKEDFSDRIWNLHHSITSIALLNEKPLHRWLTSIVILLPKDPGRLQIHRLRIINTYESKYNLVLKYFWPKQGMKKVESNKWLGNNQTGRRKNFCAVETATIDQLIIKTHRLTKFPLCIHQDDAMGCYDRIIRSHAILNSRKFGIPDNICKVYSIAYNLMQSKTQINNSVSKTSYSSTNKLKCHGVGQGAGNGRTKWTFISIPMIEVVEEVSQGCIIQVPRGSKQWENTHVSLCR